MLLSEKIAELQQALEKHGDLECIYASDDEGNSFKKVNVGGILYADVLLMKYNNFEINVLCQSDYDAMIEEEGNLGEYMKVYCVN